MLGSPLFDAGFWLHPPEGGKTYEMDVKTVSKEGLISNARWVHELASKKG